MKAILTTTLLLIALTFSAQVDSLVAKEFPINQETGQIEFSEVIQKEGVSKDELFMRSRTWFTNTFNSSESVIDMESKEDGIIVGKGNTILQIPSAVGNVPVRSHFSVTFQFKEGRYKYIITNITYDVDPTQYNNYQSGTYPIESVVIENLYKSNGKPRKLNAKWKTVVWQEYRQLAASIIEGMNNKSFNSSDDW